MTELLSDICRWLVEEENAEVVGGATTNHRQPLTNEPSWRLLVLRLLPLRRRVLWLPPLHMLVQLWDKEDRVTSRGLRHIILQPSMEEGNRWKLIIGSDKWERSWEITSDAMRIRLAVFQLEGESQVWWDWVKTLRNLKAMTWEEFCELFIGKYFQASAQNATAREFLELKT